MDKDPILYNFKSAPTPALGLKRTIILVINSFVNYFFLFIIFGQLNLIK